MTSLRQRLVRLEAGSGADGCTCLCTDIRYPGGRVEHLPTAPLCPHGRPWIVGKRYDLSHGDGPDGDWV